MRYALVGYGRMGRAIEREAAARGHEEVRVVRSAGELEAAAHDGLAGAEVAFEFSCGTAAESNLIALLDAGVSVVCGTTGWSPGPALHAAIDRSERAVIVAANFSIGVHLLYRLAAEAGRLVGNAGLHQPFLLEQHHRGKRDAPSGTARRLAELLVENDPRLSRVHEGASPDGILPDDTLQVASVRAGSDPGRHVVGYDGPHDCITLTHSARSRGGFALGAVLAGEWIRGKRGMQSFDSVVEASLSGALGANHREGEHP